MFTAASVINKGRGKAGNIHRKDMADAPLGAQALRRIHKVHEFVGVQAAFHQGRDFALPRQGHCPFGSGMAVLGIYDFVGRQIDRRLLRCSTNLRFRPNQNRDDQLRPKSLDRGQQRKRVHGMHHGGANRLQPASLRDQLPVVPAFHQTT